MARHVRVQCALIRPQGTKDSSTRDPDVNHSTFNTHTHILVCLNCSVQRRARTAMDDRCPPDAGVVGNDVANGGKKDRRRGG